MRADSKVSLFVVLIECVTWQSFSIFSIFPCNRSVAFLKMTETPILNTKINIRVQIEQKDNSESESDTES